MGSWKGGGSQYMQLVKVLSSKLLTNDKSTTTFPTWGQAGGWALLSELGGEVAPGYNLNSLEIFMKNQQSSAYVHSKDDRAY